VETNIFYIAIFPSDQNVVFNWEWFNSLPNKLADFLPEKADYSHVVKIYNLENEKAMILADIVSQKVICFTI